MNLHRTVELPHDLSSPLWDNALYKRYETKNSDEDNRVCIEMHLGMPTMSHSHPTNQSREGTGVKDISDHSIGLALVKAAFWSASDDSTCILTSMLEKRKTFADLGSSVDGRIVEKQTEDPAHCR